MSGHTKGPWFCGRALRGGQECIIGDGDSVVAFMPDRTIGCSFIREDALLIAAAPMLLEALKPIAALRKHFTSKHGTRPTSGAIAAWHTAEGSDELTVEHLIAAVEAIAAATGDTK